MDYNYNLTVINLWNGPGKEYATDAHGLHGWYSFACRIRIGKF